MSSTWIRRQKSAVRRMMGTRRNSGRKERSRKPQVASRKRKTEPKSRVTSRKSEVESHKSQRTNEPLATSRKSEVAEKKETQRATSKRATGHLRQWLRRLIQSSVARGVWAGW